MALPNEMDLSKWKAIVFKSYETYTKDQNPLCRAYAATVLDEQIADGKNKFTSQEINVAKQYRFDLVSLCRMISTRTPANLLPSSF